MVPDLFFSQLVLIALVWLCLMLQWAWPSDTAACSTTPETPPSLPKRKRDPTPFAGLTQKPHCDACEHITASRPHAPSAPPRIEPTRGRHRQVDTATHFCPNPDCRYWGWAGWGNIRANGHPNGGPWRQLLCIVCRGYFLETLGTIFHGKRVAPELIVRVIACLAEGLGIRGTARVFEVDPNTVLQWLVEGSRTCSLRIIAPPRKPGTMPPYHSGVRGLCHDSTPFLLNWLRVLQLLITYCNI